MDKNIYYLVVEARPKEFMPIDINILLKSNMNFSSIEIIDSFTKEYTYDELMNMIIQNNILPNSFLNGKLYVINDKKFRFKVLTKDDNLLLDDFFINNIEDKLMMNKFYNIFLKYLKDEDIINMMKSALITKNISQILSVHSIENLNNDEEYLKINFRIAICLDFIAGSLIRLLLE